MTDEAIFHETTCCGEGIVSFAVVLPYPQERTRCQGCAQQVFFLEEGTSKDGTPYVIWSMNPSEEV